MIIYIREAVLYVWLEDQMHFYNLSFMASSKILAAGWNWNSTTINWMDKSFASLFYMPPFIVYRHFSWNIEKPVKWGYKLLCTQAVLCKVAVWGFRVYSILIRKMLQHNFFLVRIMRHAYWLLYEWINKWMVPATVVYSIQQPHLYSVKILFIFLWLYKE